MDGSSGAYNGIQKLEATSELPTSVYGARAGALVHLKAAGLPVPKAWALSADWLRQAYQARSFEGEVFSDILQETPAVSVRASPGNRDWGGPKSLFYIGINDKLHRELTERVGASKADSFYFRYIQSYAANVARLDSEDFDAMVDQDGGINQATIDAAKAYFIEELDQEFPQSSEEQLQQAVLSLASAWHGTSARILREAKGAPSDANLGLVIQEMPLGFRDGENGSGTAQFVSPTSGERMAFGRYHSHTDMFAISDQAVNAKYLARDQRGVSLEEVAPEAFNELRDIAKTAREEFKDDVQLEFTLHNGDLHILDCRSAERAGRAALEITNGLVKDGLIDKKDALLRISPRQLNEVLHPQIDPKDTRNVLATGIGASPGAASGKIVFNATQAVAYEARGEASILVRVETTPDDIRGIHAANGVLTERGGINSHAAVVARTLGAPCVVGVDGIEVNVDRKTLRLPDGTELSEGAHITIDGTSGELLWGAMNLVEPSLGESFKDLMSWCDALRKIGVRGNADTPDDVRIAQAFGVDGIGLVRTEHMFFETERLTLMRELIFANSLARRQDALDVLLPMQRSDFSEIFALMGDRSVCIRLLDPPLHEFLPRSRAQVKSLADAMDLPTSQISARVDELSEFNPMLGTRGVRLGITLPEIYVMQARAIFEAVCDYHDLKKGALSVEVMIPLVSARKEVDLVKAQIEAVASAVRSERGHNFSYELGIMVETPRAALRSGEIAPSVAFMSMGTNDLTQMTYGLSRDDAGRFMSQYIRDGIFSEDPFHTLDVEGVGELLEFVVERSRKHNPEIILGLCGEHGGDPESIMFCIGLGFDYVSCSPFRAPIAKLTAAKAEIIKKADL